MKAKEIVQKYDSIDCKQFDESDIVIELYSIPVEEREELENKAEWFAFAFSEGSDNQWNTYYGPMCVLSNGTCEPSKDSITEEMLQYWISRMEAVVNPVLKARYSGVLVEFMPKSNCIGNIRKTHLQSLLDSVNGFYLKREINAAKKLCRAFTIAINSKNDDDIGTVKDSIVSYELAVASDYDMRLWGTFFSLMLSNLKHFSNEENAFVNRMEERVERLLNKPIDGKGTERFDVGVIEHGIDLLAQYYHKKNNREELLRVLNTLNEAIHKSFPNMKPTHRDALLDRMFRLYNQYKFHSEANVALTEYQQNSVNISEEMTTIINPSEIPEQKIDFEITAQSFDDVMAAFLFSFIPDRNESVKELQRKAKRNPLFYACSHHSVDYKGRPSSIIKGDESNINGFLISHMYSSLIDDCTMVHAFIQEAIKKEFFTPLSIMGFIKNCPFFESDRLSIIEQGLNAYFMGDWVVFMHLIIPQIENAVRNIVEMSERNTIKPQRHGDGFELRTFEDLLRDDAIVYLDDNNLSLYMRALFTDPNGWNLRNSICHGIAPLSFFNQAAADRVFHALSCVAAIRLITPRQSPDLVPGSVTV